MADEIKIKADVDLSKANEEFKKLSIRVKELDYEFRKQKISAQSLNAGLDEVARSANALNLSYKQTVDLSAQIFQVQQRAANNFSSLSGSLASMDKKMSTANQTLISFSQGMQDSAQFSMGFNQGLRGIANNIQQMSQMFGLLYKETGSFKNALSLMWTQLASPAGALIGLAALTTAFQLLTDSAGQTKKEFNDISDLLDRKFNAGWISSTKYIDDTRKAIDDLIVEVSNPSFMERLANIAKFGLGGVGLGGNITDAESEKLLDVVNKEDKIILNSFKRKEDSLKIQIKKTDLDVKSLETLLKFMESESWLLKTDEARNDVALRRIAIQEKINAIQEKEKKKSAKELSDAEKFDYELQFEMQEKAKKDLEKMNEDYAKGKTATEKELFRLEQERQKLEEQGAKYKQQQAEELAEIQKKNAEQAERDAIKITQVLARSLSAGATSVLDSFFSEIDRAKQREERKEDRAEREKYQKEVANINKSMQAGEAKTRALQDAEDRYYARMDQLDAQRHSVWNNAWMAMRNTAINALEAVLQKMMELFIFRTIMNIAVPGSGSIIDSTSIGSGNYARNTGTSKGRDFTPVAISSVSNRIKNQRQNIQVSGKLIGNGKDLQAVFEYQSMQRNTRSMNIPKR